MHAYVLAKKVTTAKTIETRINEKIGDKNQMLHKFYAFLHQKTSPKTEKNITPHGTIKVNGNMGSIFILYLLILAAKFLYHANDLVEYFPNSTLSNASRKNKSAGRGRFLFSLDRPHESVYPPVSGT